MGTVSRIKPLRVRTVWISDVHLGFRGCSAELLLDFLHSVECETLYLVGDIVDIWSMKRSLYWPQAHNNVVRALLGKAKHDTRVVFVPGNHDEMFRAYEGMEFGNIAIHDEVVHELKDGRRFLVLHGDAFDSVVQCSPWLAKLGSHAYDALLYCNRWVNRARRRMGLGYWSLAGYLKHKVKNAVNYICDFEEAVAREARERDLDGVVCGHIHHAEIREVGGVQYLNCGDWVESHTALVERHDGKVELLHWRDLIAEHDDATDRLAAATAG